MKVPFQLQIISIEKSYSAVDTYQKEGKQFGGFLFGLFFFPLAEDDKVLSRLAMLVREASGAL